MEIHSVLPEERARTEKGDYLPWGYRYSDSARNARQVEESGPFGRNRSVRLTGSRRASTRAATTPSRQKENSAVADFGRLYAREQAKEDESRNTPAASTAANPPSTDAPRVEHDAVPTECILYGYANKTSEWKVISKYERIVSPGIICEDYPREDPNLYLNSASPMGLTRSVVVVHKNLSKEALKKSRVYKGGQHWIKITFDSYEAADRARFYSPVVIDGCSVYCDLWDGQPPVSDVAIPANRDIGELVAGSTKKPRTVGTASGRKSAVAGFERAFSSTLPRSQTLPDLQYAQPALEGGEDAISEPSSVTASSATAHDIPTESTGLSVPDRGGLRSRSVPNLSAMPSSSSSSTPNPPSQYMTHIPTVKRAVLRPITEALPPQPNLFERALRSLPLVSWFFGTSEKATPGQTISGGPVLNDDGTWNAQKNGWYWSLWYTVDSWLGTDFCSLKED